MFPALPNRRFASATAAAVLVVAALASCASTDDVSSGGPLSGLPEAQGVQVINSVAKTKPMWHYGSWTVCVNDDGGPVTLDSVVVAKSGSIDVSGVGVKKLDLETLEGSMPGQIPGTYTGVAGFLVSGRCSDNDGAEIVIQVDTPSTSASVDDFSIRYHRGPARYEVKYSARIVLCVDETEGKTEAIREDCAVG